MKKITLLFLSFSLLLFTGCNGLFNKKTPPSKGTHATLELTFNIGARLTDNIDVSVFMTAAHISDADEFENLAKTGSIKLYYLGTNEKSLEVPLVIPYADTEESRTFESDDYTFTGSGAHYWVVNDDTAITFSSNINAVINGTRFKLIDERI